LTELETEIYPNAGNWDNFFANKNDIILEIWTGLWNYFSKNVNENIWKNFIWMEIRYKRCFMTAEKTLWKVKNNDNSKDNTSLKEYNNDFVIIKDYAERVDKIFWKWELSETLIFFPDPWARKKWLKKRLVQETFLNNLYERTKKGWKMIFKTDHIWYFLHVLQEIENTKWKLDFKTFDYESEGLYKSNAITEFEQIFRWQDIKVNYLELIRK
jgi:tRNA (guanine-N7-)-methyltransferase